MSNIKNILFLLPQLNTDFVASCTLATPLVGAGVLCGARATQIHAGTCRTGDATCVLRTFTDSTHFVCVSQGVVDR